MTRKRITRIIEQQEERLRLQQEYLEAERKKQEKNMKSILQKERFIKKI